MKRKIWIPALTVLLALVLGCGMYVGDYYRAEETFSAVPEGITLQTQEDRMVFLPERAEAGLIFYPGGKVEFTAYAPLMARLAENNVLCVLLKMPLNLAVLDVGAAEGIPEQFPQVENWCLAGHSLGGSMAASYAAGDGAIHGLILLAAYSTSDLKETDLRVLSLRGDRDGVLNPEKYETYFPNLPEDTREEILEGGNHAGFGCYGPQEGDGISSLEPGEQIQWTAEQILDFIRE